MRKRTFWNRSLRAFTRNNIVLAHALVDEPAEEVAHVVVRSCAAFVFTMRQKKFCGVFRRRRFPVVLFIIEKTLFCACQNHRLRSITTRPRIQFTLFFFFCFVKHRREKSFHRVVREEISSRDAQKHPRLSEFTTRTPRNSCTTNSGRYALTSMCAFRGVFDYFFLSSRFEIATIRRSYIEI